MAGVLGAGLCCCRVLMAGECGVELCYLHGLNLPLYMHAHNRIFDHISYSRCADVTTETAPIPIENPLAAASGPANEDEKDAGGAEAGDDTAPAPAAAAGSASGTDETVPDATADVAIATDAAATAAAGTSDIAGDVKPTEVVEEPAVDEKFVLREALRSAAQKGDLQVMMVLMVCSGGAGDDGAHGLLWWGVCVFIGWVASCLLVISISPYSSTNLLSTRT
jgi:hypothetical protein